MRRTILPAVFLAISSFCAAAGQIQIGEKWYTFEDIVSTFTVVKTDESTWHVSSGRPSDFFEQPTRIIATFGDWLESRRGKDLASRFFALHTPSVTITEGDLNMEFVLAHRTKNETGEHQLTLYMSEDLETHFDSFLDLVKAASEDGSDYRHKTCLELRGHMYFAVGDNSRQFDHYFHVKEIKIVGKIPTGQGAVPSVEEATKLCTPQT